MRRHHALSAPLAALLGCCACPALLSAQAPLKTLDAVGGGRIVYGAVGGAGNQAAAMSAALRSVHTFCGEKPTVGNVFAVRGSRMVAAFFSVVNHAGGGQPWAGMVLAVQSGPGRFEAGLVANAASRLGSTLNPMLDQLYGAWHPDGLGQVAGGRPGPAAGHPGPAVQLHRVAASDNSASVGIPAGWQAKGQGGTMMVSGPHGETIGLDLTRMAKDPRGGMHGPKQILFPADADLARAFPNLFQQFWQVNGVSISGLQIDRLEPLPGIPPQRGVHATGRLSFGVNNPQEMNAMLSTTPPNGVGGYLVMLSVAYLPPAVADQERGTVGAILASFQPNPAVIRQEIGALAGPMLEAIHQIGREADARYAATQVANDQQHATWAQGQDNQAKQGQGFSNYLLDQTVIADSENNAHATVWNGTANALVKANPDRFQIVDYPGYWKGIDY